MAVKIAVILSGCGNKDGSEIHESVLTLLAIDKAGAAYQCYAPDILQHHVTNFLTNEPLKETRRVLLESARIARSRIKSLMEFKAEDFDALILPGGQGAAYNLCTFAIDGVNMKIDPDVEQAIRTMVSLKKPVGVLCIAPVLIAKLLGEVDLTFGQDEKLNAAFKPFGTRAQNTTAVDIVVDKRYKIVSTPCYMLADARISEVATGIERLVNKVIEMAG